MSSSAVFITQSQLEAMRAQFSDPQATHAAADRARRKELSETRAAKWPNTIEAQRARKEVLRIQALEEAEAERCKEDARRSVIKAEERRMQVERANKMLYDQTDRIKMFHSTLLRSDVQQENEKQMDLKRHVTTLQRELDDKFLEQQREALELAEQAELLKMEERLKAALDQKRVQLVQLEETKAKLLADRERRMVEGKMLLEAAEREKAKEIEAAMKRREEAQQRNLDMIRANDALLEYRRVQAERERKADEQVAAYAARKAAIIEERKRREKARQAEKEARRDAMVKYMEDNLEAERKKNERQLAKAADDSEAKRAADMAERNRQATEMQMAIDKSRAQQLQLKLDRKAREAAEETEFCAAWEVRLAQLKQEDEDEKAARYARNKHQQALLLRQMNQKKLRKDADKDRAMQEAFASRLAIAEEDQMFDEYSSLCLDTWSRAGKPIVPMTIALTKQKKQEERDIMPSIVR